MRKLSRRKVLKGLGATALSLPFLQGARLAFAQDEWAVGTPQLSTPLSEQVVTFYNWGDLSGDPGTATNIEAFTDRTGIQVNAIQTPVQNVVAKMVTALAARSSEIDIVEVLDENLIDFVQRGWLEPLDSFIDPAEVAAWAPAARQVAVYDESDAASFGQIPYEGSLYGTPWFGESVMMFFNREHLAQVGVSEPPTNFSDFAELAVELKNAGVARYPIIFPYSTYDTGFQIPRNFVLRSGGNFFNGVQPDFLNEQVVEGFTFLSDLVTRHEVVSPSVINVDEGGASLRFVQGQASFLINESPTASLFLEELGSKEAVEEKYGAAILPVPDGVGYLDTPTQELKTYMAAVSTASRRKEAAVEFARFFQSLEAHSNELLIEWNMPLRPEVWDAQQVRQTLPFAETFRQAAAGSSRQLVPEQGQIMTEFWQISMNAFLGRETPEEVLRQGQDLAERILNR